MKSFLSLSFILRVSFNLKQVPPRSAHEFLQLEGVIWLSLPRHSPSCLVAVLETPSLSRGRPLTPFSPPMNFLQRILSWLSLLFIGWRCPAGLILLQFTALLVLLQFIQLLSLVNFQLSAEVEVTVVTTLSLGTSAKILRRQAEYHHNLFKACTSTIVYRTFGDGGSFS